MSLKDKCLVDPFKCHLCGICVDLKNRKKKSFRSTVEIHHIIEQNQKIINTSENLIPLCSNCHSMVHENIIKLDRWYFSTKGWVFHYWDATGKDLWK